MIVMNKTLIDLLKGWPNPALLPSAQIKTASSAALSDCKVFTPGLLYGPDEGYKPARKHRQLAYPVLPAPQSGYCRANMHHWGSKPEPSVHSPGFLGPTLYEECVDGLANVLPRLPNF